MVAYVGAYMVAYVGAYMVSYVGAYMVAYVGSYMIMIYGDIYDNDQQQIEHLPFHGVGCTVDMYGGGNLREGP